MDLCIKLVNSKQLRTLLKVYDCVIDPPFIKRISQRQKFIMFLWIKKDVMVVCNFSRGPDDGQVPPNNPFWTYDEWEMYYKIGVFA